MAPQTRDGQTVWTSRITIEPTAWSFSYVDYWGTNVTTFELHEPHERLTVHSQAVVDTRGDEIAWDTERRPARNDLGWPAAARPRRHRPDDRLPHRDHPYGAAARADRPGRARWRSSRRGWPVSTSAGSCTTASPTGAARPR